MADLVRHLAIQVAYVLVIGSALAYRVLLTSPTGVNPLMGFLALCVLITVAVLLVHWSKAYREGTFWARLRHKTGTRNISFVQGLGGSWIDYYREHPVSVGRRAFGSHENTLVCPTCQETLQYGAPGIRTLLRKKLSYTAVIACGALLFLLYSLYGDRDSSSAWREVLAAAAWLGLLVSGFWIFGFFVDWRKDEGGIFGSYCQMLWIAV